MRVRAAEVAQRCAAPRVERASLSEMMREAEFVYVVGKQEEFVFGEEGRLVAGEGLMKLKRTDGAQHPLIRAVAPDGTKTRTVFDGTLGGAQDALHLSVVAQLTVDGVDASPALVCLVENFLGRATDRWGDAARRVRATCGDALGVLKTLPTGAYDVVFLDPMFDRALASQPDFRVLRGLALDAPMTEVLLAEAVRVARQRVVVKVRTLSHPGVDPPAPGWNRRVSARAFDYWVVENALENPTLDPQRARYSTQKLRYLGILS